MKYPAFLPNTLLLPFMEPQPGVLQPPANRGLAAQFPRHLTRPLLVIWVGGGQDSVALMMLYLFDAEFRARFATAPDGLPYHVIAVMSDTGDEFPETYAYVQYLQQFCPQHGLEFYFLTADLGYHSAAWPSLAGQMRRNNTIMSVAFPKTCTDQLKIQVCYRFIEQYLTVAYGLTAPGPKQVFYQYARRWGKLQGWIGFAKGEEGRVATPASPLPGVDPLFLPEIATLSTLSTKNINQKNRKLKKDHRPVWVKRNVANSYPLIDLGLDRAGCQAVIAGYGQPVPMPSNCKKCPFMNGPELVYVDRFLPADFAEWEALEGAKLAKHAHKARNLGVKGKNTLRHELDDAKAKFGHWTDEQLKTYKFSHGHCVVSAY